MQITGECMYCGQMVTVSVDENSTNEDVRKEATFNCSCEKAKDYTKKQKSIEKVKNKIEEIFPAHEDIQMILNHSVESILRGMVEKVTISQGTTKAVLSINGKGEIKVEKTRTLKEGQTI